MAAAATCPPLAPSLTQVNPVTNNLQNLLSIFLPIFLDQPLHDTTARKLLNPCMFWKKVLLVLGAYQSYSFKDTERHLTFFVAYFPRVRILVN